MKSLVPHTHVKYPVGLLDNKLKQSLHPGWSCVMLSRFAGEFGLYYTGRGYPRDNRMRMQRGWHNSLGGLSQGELRGAGFVIEKLESWQAEFYEIASILRGLRVLEMLAKMPFPPPSYRGTNFCPPLYMAARRVGIASFGRFFQRIEMLAAAIFATAGGYLTKKWYNTPRACS